MKIMRGDIGKIPETCSENLRHLILRLMERDPGKRPTVAEVMAMPIMMGPILKVMTGMGAIPCSRYVSSSFHELSVPYSTRSLFSDLGHSRLASIRNFGHLSVPGRRTRFSPTTKLLLLPNLCQSRGACVALPLLSILYVALVTVLYVLSELYVPF